MRQKSVFAIIAGMVLWIGLPARAESVSKLLEKGIYTEETVGDLEGAMKIYAQIVADADANRRYVAKAQYRLGMCHIKKGDKADAAEAFKRVLAKFSDQRPVFAKARRELAKLGAFAAGPPVVLSSSPPAFADDVSPSLKTITVTFDRPMMDKSWSWTGGEDSFPKITGKIRYDSQKMTCMLPVKLERGKVYSVGINSPSHKNFKTAAYIPAQRHVILFATKGAGGKPTPIPENQLAQAREINSQPREVPADPPKVVRTDPSVLANNVSPSLDKITVTFDRPMMDKSWSWTGGGDTYPGTRGRPYYDDRKMTCTLPVKLEPGKVYWVGINSPGHKNFKTADGVAAPWYVILFATKGSDGKATPIPQDMLTKARDINARAQAAVGREKGRKQERAVTNP